VKRQDALYAASCIGTIAFCVTFVLPQFTEQAVLQYFPLDRGWELTAKPAGLAMDFYGRLLQGVVAAAIAIVVTLVITSRVKTEKLPQKAASLLVAWAIAFVVLVMMYYAWTLAFRVPNAAPIPDWYIPR
jgi:RsiW-degrading membrane proteinase PrsW (M82 family)